MPTLDDESVAKLLAKDAKATALGVAKIRGMALGQKQYTPEEEDLMWNQVADGWTPEKELALLAEGKSREEVGSLKYKHRLQMMASGERALSKYEQARYADQRAKKADPAWQTPVPPGSQPPVMPSPESADDLPEWGV